MFPFFFFYKLYNSSYSRQYLFTLVLIFVFISGCSESPPTTPDGENNITITALWDSSGTGQNYIPMSNSIVILLSEYGRIQSTTDSKGKLNLNGLPSTEYKISVRKAHPYKAGYIITGTGTIIAEPTQSYEVTIKGEPIKNSNLIINEVYFSCPQTEFFYFEDQFIELYNSSNSTQYLDGLIIIRSTTNDDGSIGAGEDHDKDGQVDIVHYAYSFPGNPGGSKYPIKPGQFIVAALDAVDHRKFVSGSIDLSGADWEFMNQYSVQEYDNPAVPNLINLLPQMNYDFYFNLQSDVILLCSGVDRNLSDGMDISTILDGLEYQVNYQFRKTIDPAIDKSFALSPARYTGRSLQRIEPGSDSNDSELDFEIIQHPTPGYQ